MKLQMKTTKKTRLNYAKNCLELIQQHADRELHALTIRSSERFVPEDGARARSLLYISSQAKRGIELAEGRR